MQALSVLTSWQGLVPRDPAPCFRIDLDRGEFVRVVAELMERPLTAAFSVEVYAPGDSLPMLRARVGGVPRRSVTWRAESAGPHHLVLSGGVLRTDRSSAPRARLWIEAIEPPALAAARRDALARDPRVEFLRREAMPLRSIDPDDDDFRDLAPLREKLAGVRVVLLGEGDHFSGSDFSAKSRMVRFLHQELGFDVLAFESGLYGMSVAADSLRAGMPGREAVALGAYGFWTDVAQMQPLLRYLAEASRSSSPIELAGFDNQFMGSAPERRLADELARFLAETGIGGPLAEPGSPEREVLHSLATIRYRTRQAPLPHAEHRERVLRALGEASTRLAGLEDGEAAFWVRVLAGTACLARRVFAMDGEEELQPACYRDRQMAEHLLWLANERFAGRRIIAWTATGHAMRTEELSPAAGRGASLGYFVGKALGDEAYVIGATSYRGTHGPREPHHIVPDQHPLPEFEELMAQAGFEVALVDLRSAARAGSWLGGPFLARAEFGSTVEEAVWSDHLDALLFIRVQEQPRATNGR